MQPSQAPIRLPANIALVGITFIGLLFAVLLGSLIGNNEPRPLLVIALVALGIFFAVSLYRYVWQIALSLIFLGFGFRPTSFSFGPLELACALGVAVIALFIWQKKTIRRPEILTDPSFRLVERLLFIWLLYVALHVVFNVRAPYLPAEFRLQNAVKSYFVVSAPLLLLFYFARNPFGLVVGRDFFWRITQLLFAGLVINLAIRFWEMAGGRPIFIPLLNSSPSGYTIRALGPLAMLFGVVGLNGPATERKTMVRTCVFGLLLILGAVASVFSGGRVTVVYGFLCVCLVLVLRRKVAALALMVGVVLLGLVTANLFSNYINTEAHVAVQRSMQWALIDKDWQAVRDLNASTNWRIELGRRALAEWTSDARIFWTGRATFGFGAADDTALLIAGGYEALIETALRRGATHNLITDLLVAYGVVGFFIYFALYLALIRFLWKLHRSKHLSPPAVNLALICFVYSVYSFILDITSGGYYPFDVLWCLLVLIAAFYNGVGLTDPRARLASQTGAKPHAATHREAIKIGRQRFVRTGRV